MSETAYVPPGGAVADAFFKNGYTAPAGNAADVQFGEVSAASTTVFPTGSDSAAFGTPGVANRNLEVYPDGSHTVGFGTATVVNGSRQLLPTGINSFAAGTAAVALFTRYLSPASIGAAAYGATSVRNQRHFITLSGVAPGSVGSHTVADPLGTQTLTVSGFAAGSFGAVQVSPRFLRPTGIGPLTLGTPGVQRNPSPLGFDSLVFGTATIADRTKTLAPNGIAAGSAGLPDVSDLHQDVFVPSLVETTLFGDAEARNQRRFLAPEGFSDFTSLSYTLVENFFKELKPFGTVVSSYGRPGIRNAADAIYPAGIDSLAMGVGSEMGVGFSTRSITPFGQVTSSFGVATVTKPPALLPSGFDAARYGTAEVSARSRTVTANGFAGSAFGVATVWDAVRAVNAAGTDQALYGAAVVGPLNRSLDLAGRGAAATLFGAHTAQLKVRTLAPDGIGFNYTDRRQFGTARLSDGTQRVTALGAVPGDFGTLTVARNERLLLAEGIAPQAGTPDVQLRTRYLLARGDEVSLQGTPRIFNSRQYVTITEGAFEAAAGTGLVINRNRVIQTYGVDTARVPSGAEALNNARLVAPEGALGDFGQASVAHRVRTVEALGFDSASISYWPNVRNTTAILEPSGIARGRMGVPYVWDNTQRIDCNGSRTFMFEAGVPFVAPRIRTLAVDRFGVDVPAWPLPYVGLYTRTLAPAGPEGAFGDAFLEIHRNVISIFGRDEAKCGEPAMRNNTPELLVGSQEPPTNPQKPWVSFRVRPIAPEGALQSGFGTAFVGQRTRCIGTPGIDSLKIPLLHRVEFDAPEIPGNQRILPSGFDESFVPQPIMSRRTIYAEGFGTTLWGVPVITSTCLFPTSVVLAEDSQVPAPKVIGPQYVRCNTSTGEMGGDGNVSGWIDMPARYGVPAIFPHYIRMSEDMNGIFVKPEGVMDYGKTGNGSGIYDRPFFGNPTVELRHRTVRVTNSADAFQPLLGSPTAIHRVRKVAPAGLLSQRFGFPIFPFGLEITPYWGRDTEDWIEGEDYDTALYGQATVAHAVVYDPNVRPVGLAPPVGEGARVELRIRVVAPPGAASAFAAGQARVHPPEPLMPSGITGSVGVPGISYFVRTIKPEGFDSFENEYEPGSFDFGVMTVRRRNQLLPPGLLASTIPEPILTLPDLGAVATLGDQSAFGRPRLGACAC